MLEVRVLLCVRLQPGSARFSCATPFTLVSVPLLVLPKADDSCHQHEKYLAHVAAHPKHAHHVFSGKVLLAGILDHT